MSDRGAKLAKPDSAESVEPRSQPGWGERQKIRKASLTPQSAALLRLNSEAKQEMSRQASQADEGSPSPSHPASPSVSPSAQRRSETRESHPAKRQFSRSPTQKLMHWQSALKRVQSNNAKDEKRTARVLKRQLSFVGNETGPTSSVARRRRFLGTLPWKRDYIENTIAQVQALVGAWRRLL